MSIELTLGSPSPTVWTSTLPTSCSLTPPLSGKSLIFGLGLPSSRETESCVLSPAVCRHIVWTVKNDRLPLFLPQVRGSRTCVPQNHLESVSLLGPTLQVADSVVLWCSRVFCCAIWELHFLQVPRWCVGCRSRDHTWRAILGEKERKNMLPGGH